MNPTNIVSPYNQAAAFAAPYLSAAKATAMPYINSAVAAATPYFNGAVKFAAPYANTAYNTVAPYVAPAAQSLSATVQQIQSSALIQSTATQVIAFAATPLGMGLIGAVALAALVGAVILIHRRYAEQAPLPPAPEPRPFFGPEPFPGPQRAETGVSPVADLPRPIQTQRAILALVATGDQSLQGATTAALGPAVQAGIEVMLRRAENLPQVRETSSALAFATTETRAPHMLGVTPAELTAAAAHFGPAQQDQLYALLQDTGSDLLLVLDTEEHSSTGPLALKDKDSEEDKTPVVNNDVVKALVAVAQAKLGQSSFPQDRAIQPAEEVNTPPSTSQAKLSKKRSKWTQVKGTDLLFFLSKEAGITVVYH